MKQWGQSYISQPCIHKSKKVHPPHIGSRAHYPNSMHHSRFQHHSGHPTLSPHLSTIYPTNSNLQVNYFLKYLAHCELVATGLLQFNDKPQNYRAWKCSFQTAISSLNLTTSEGMALLLKWLGKESAEYVE